MNTDDLEIGMNMRKSLDMLKQNMDEFVDFLAYKAKIQKKYYGELIKQGFTKDQAVELSKDIFKF